MRVADAFVEILFYYAVLMGRFPKIIQATTVSSDAITTTAEVGAPEAVEQGAVDFRMEEAHRCEATTSKEILDPESLEDDREDSSTSTDNCHDSEGESCVSPARYVHQQPDGANILPPQEDRGLRVPTGMKDGVSIELLGRRTGTIPGPNPREQQMEQYARTDSEVAELQARGAERTRERFEKLRCEGGDSGDDRSGGAAALNLSNISNNMLRKLMQSGQPREEDVVEEAQQEPAGPEPAEASREGHGTIGGYLGLLTAPASYLMSLVGSVPDWFGEAVFVVSGTDGVGEGEVPKRILLVQDPPRSLRAVCALLNPLLGTASRPRGGQSTALKRLGRSICNLDSPFPGKSVSRPCLLAQAQESGFMGFLMRKVLLAVGMGGGVFSGASGLAAGGRWSGSCKCAEGGAGACMLRAVPGRKPCVYVETSPWRGQRRPGIGREMMDATSSVGLLTYEVPLAAEPGPRAWATGEGRGSRGDSSWEKMVDGWRAAAAKLGVPRSVILPTYAARLTAGAAFLFLARPLSESRVFHYFLSALFGGGFAVAALLLRALGNPRRTMLRTLFAGASLVWVLMAAGGELVPSPASVVGALPGIMWAFWNEGSWGFLWAGKAFYAVSALFGVTMTRWQGLFLDEDESWFNGQVFIRRLLMISGVLLVYYGVSDPEIGMVLVLAVLSAPPLAHLARRFHMWTNRSKWYRAAPTLSEAEYEHQGDECTRRELEKLRLSMMEDPRRARKQVKPSTRRRMAAFIESGEHCNPYAESSVRRSGWGTGCAVQ